MNGISMEPAGRLRRPVPSLRRDQLGWRVASLTVSLASVVLILQTLAYKLRDLQPPLILLLALTVAFGTVVLLLSKFLRLANRQHSRTVGALDTSEQQFESVFDSVLDAILIVDDQAVCRDANPAAEQLFGSCRRELIGKPVISYYLDPRQFHQQWQLLLTEKFHRGEAELMRDGEHLVVEYAGKMDCLPHRHVMILRDITERRRAERSLVESEERFRQMASSIQEMFWMMDAESRHVVYVNQAYETITGRSCQSLRDNPTSYQELLHPAERNHVLARMAQAQRSGRFNEQFRIVRPDGDVIWLWVRGFPVRDGGGSIRRFVGTAVEITAQKEAETKVAENLSMAEALRRATLSLTQDLNMDSVMDTLLGCLAELVPYTCARVLVPEEGLSLLVLGARMDAQRAQSSSVPLLGLIAGDSPIVEELLSQKRAVMVGDTDQKKAWATFQGHESLRSWLSVPLFSSHKYLGCLSIGHYEPNRFKAEHLRRAEMLAVPAAAAIQNARLYAQAEIYADELEKRISELRQVETRKRCEHMFEEIFRNAPAAISITTFDEGRFVDVNRAFECRYGYSRNELIGHTVFEVGLWEAPADRKLMTTQLKHGRHVQSLITRLRTKSGQMKLTAYSAGRLQWDGQSCIVDVSEDVPPQDPQQSN